MKPVTFLFAMFVSTTGCGGDDAPPDGGDGPLYMVSTVVYSGDDQQAYLVPVHSLEAGATFDLDAAIEIPESLVAVRTGDSHLYTSTLDAPVITRWDIGSDGSIEAGPKLSFANLGISYAWPIDSTQFYSDERAYFTEDTGRQVVVWNPKEMAIVGTIPLDAEPDGLLLPWQTMAVRQDRIFAVSSWNEDSSHDFSHFGDHVRIFEIDPATDTIVNTTDEPRCNYFTWPTTTSNGTTYFSPMSYYAPIRSMLGAGHGIENCALRVVPGGHSFDQGYDVDLTTLVGGRPAGTMFLVNDDVAFIRVWHSELVDPVAPDKSNWQDVLNEAGFQWWRWDLGSPTATLIPDQTPSASEVSALFDVDGRKLVPAISEDYSTTVLQEMDPAGALHPVLTGPGNIRGIVRVR